MFDPLTPGTLRQLDRRLVPDHPSRGLWRYVNAFDWNSEVHAISRPSLLYWGSDDRQMAKKLRRAQTQLLLQHVDFAEFAGLDHAACNAWKALEDHVVPAVDQWLLRRVGRDW